MKAVITRVFDKNEIFDILVKFTPYLQSLRDSEANCDLLAGKFCGYGIVLCIKIRDEVVAFAAFYCNNIASKKAYLSMIAVLPKYEKCGMGKALLIRAKEISHECGMEKLRLEVRINNLNAIRFYEKQGFVRVDDNMKSIYMETSVI